MGKYRPFDDEVRSLTTDAKIMLTQLPFLILLSISIFICYINAFAFKRRGCSSTHASDLTEPELQLRGTTENREFDF